VLVQWSRKRVTPTEDESFPIRRDSARRRKRSRGAEAGVFEKWGILGGRLKEKAKGATGMGGIEGVTRFVGDRHGRTELRGASGGLRTIRTAALVNRHTRKQQGHARDAHARRQREWRLLWEEKPAR